jgi:hypothetical protein
MQKSIASSPMAPTANRCVQFIDRLKLKISNSLAEHRIQKQSSLHFSIRIDLQRQSFEAVIARLSGTVILVRVFS